MKRKVTRKTYTPKVITVRDRREVHQFSIHNRVIDEWFPIIGPTGYALYSLYVRMSNSADERAYPGFVSIREHFGFGYTTITHYNELLVWCKLIHIERYKLPDGRRYRNDYLILPITEAGDDARARVRNRVAVEMATAMAQEKTDERWIKFLNMTASRLDTWQSIQMIWEKNRPDKSLKVVRAQLELPFACDDPVDNSDGALPQGENPTTPGGEPHYPRGRTPLPQGERNNPYTTILIQQSKHNNPTTTPMLLLLIHLLRMFCFNVWARLALTTA